MLRLHILDNLNGRESERVHSTGASPTRTPLTYSVATSIRPDQYGMRWRTELSTGSTEPAGPPQEHAATAAEGE